jgi:hypothetical protein
MHTVSGYAPRGGCFRLPIPSTSFNRSEITASLKSSPQDSEQAEREVRGRSEAHECKPKEHQTRNS